MALRRAFVLFVVAAAAVSCLAAEAVQGATLAFEGIDDVHGRDSLALGMLGVGDGVADDVLEKDLEHAARLLVDQARDALDTATASQATDGGLGDALDVVAQHLPVTLSATLSQTLASLTTSRHSELVS
jgi:hypothetical protein